MTATTCHRLEGLEPDNLLAFLALLGTLRALGHYDTTCDPAARLSARVAWTLDKPPTRPMLFLARRMTLSEVAGAVAAGVETVADAHAFDGRADLNHNREECRALLKQTALVSNSNGRGTVDLLASLMSDACIKDDRKEPIDPTPLCLLFGQGHQHFLDRLANVPRQAAPPPRGRGRQAVTLSAAACLAEALFEPWHRADPTSGFRWDPAEDVRYAMMAGDPTDGAYKPGTQHGANRLAAVGLAALTLAPMVRGGRVRPAVLGGSGSAAGFSLAWPIWREPATLPAIRAMLAHPALRQPGALRHLGVEEVLVAQRISVGKFMNFSRARPVGAAAEHTAAPSG